MRRRVPVIAKGGDVIRPVCVCLVAITIIALAMTIQGWHVTSLALGIVTALIAAALVYQVHLSVKYFRNQSGAIRRSAREAEQHYTDVLQRIVRYVEARDPYKLGHSRRVAELSEKIALKIGLGEGEARQLHQAGQLHDIGLLAVPDGILTRRARIGVEGFQRIKQHSEIAYELLKPLGSLEEILPAIRYHHERMNGTGYPQGLSGDEIPVGARVLAVADSYEAMTHDRPHRPAMTPLNALRELRRCAPAGYCEKC
ncbi:MAG TPA: HD domain-containing phosphohydrolase, partial [Phycisphaerae bacterium]|nr:HD domain-containing phosphohydrolase [Phycisphaerae bacterium]